MKKMVKRSLALLFVVALVLSMMVVPASAANASFYNKGPIETRKRSVEFSFAGYGIDYVQCVRNDSNAPTMSLNVKWAPAGDTCTGTLNLSGGKHGTYQYDIRLCSNSSSVALATLWVFVTV